MASLSRAEELLSPELFALFSQLLPFEQAHALRVFEGIRSEGHTQPDLLAAALLHDVGKSRYPLRPWQRAVSVLLKQFSPETYQRIGEMTLNSWRAAIVVAAQHPRWGAEMAAEAGAAPSIQELILHHQDDDLSPLSEANQSYLKILQQVDENN